MDQSGPDEERVHTHTHTVKSPEFEPIPLWPAPAGRLQATRPRQQTTPGQRSEHSAASHAKSRYVHTKAALCQDTEGTEWVQTYYRRVGVSLKRT